MMVQKGFSKKIDRNIPLYEKKQREVPVFKEFPAIF